VLCTLANDIGVPFVKKFSSVMRSIYTMINNFDNSNSLNSSNISKSIAVFQGFNKAGYDTFKNPEEFNVENMNEILNTLVTTIENNDNKYCLVTLVATEAFMSDKLAVMFQENFGSFASKFFDVMSSVPVHVYLILKEHDPLKPDDPDARVMRVDAGLDFNNTLYNREYDQLFYNFDFRVYTQSTPPNDVVQRQLSYNLVMPFSSRIAVYDFDTCVDLAVQFKAYCPKYDILYNNCQHIAFAYEHAVCQGELGILNTWKTVS